MWELQKKIRTLVAAMLAHRQSDRQAIRGPVTDWLPPVLGPNDWSVGIMADGGATWYFDRN
jgi:hypothetical protein